MLLDYVRQLEGIPKEERRERILKILDRMGSSYRLEHYSAQELTNIIVTKGKGSRTLAVTHYDVVPNSPGANDNCSTIAVMFDVIKKLRHYKPKGCIELCIFDQEEIGCIGSRAYVRKHGIKGIRAVFDMELVGMGDMLGIWPVTHAVEDSVALGVLRKTIRSLGYYHEEAGRFPAFYGDYLPFREAGLKDSFCISVVPKQDRELLRQFVKMPRILLVLRYMFRYRIPTLFKHYHSPEDRSEHLNEGALKMTSDVLYHALLGMDR